MILFPVPPALVLAYRIDELDLSTLNEQQKKVVESLKARGFSIKSAKRSTIAALDLFSVSLELSFPGFPGKISVDINEPVPKRNFKGNVLYYVDVSTSLSLDKSQEIGEPIGKKLENGSFSARKSESSDFTVARLSSVFPGKVENPEGIAANLDALRRAALEFLERAKALAPPGDSGPDAQKKLIESLKNRKFSLKNIKKKQFFDPFDVRLELEYPGFPGEIGIDIEEAVPEKDISGSVKWHANISTSLAREKAREIGNPLAEKFDNTVFSIGKPDSSGVSIARFSSLFSGKIENPEKIALGADTVRRAALEFLVLAKGLPTSGDAEDSDLKGLPLTDSHKILLSALKKAGHRRMKAEEQKGTLSKTTIVRFTGPDGNFYVSLNVVYVSIERRITVPQSDDAAKTRYEPILKKRFPEVKLTFARNGNETLGYVKLLIRTADATAVWATGALKQTKEAAALIAASKPR